MKTLKQFRWFTIYEYEKEQEYLRDMNKKGWRFLKVTGFGTYHFEECAPEDVVYQLDYNQEGLKNKDEYVQMFADCGWEHLQEYAGYSYFRKKTSEMNGEEEIFCDEESRLKMMERVFKGRMLPLLLIFCCVLIPQMILNIVLYHNYIVAAIYGFIVAIYLATFAYCAKRFIDYKNNKR